MAVHIATFKNHQASKLYNGEMEHILPLPPNIALSYWPYDIRMSLH